MGKKSERRLHELGLSPEIVSIARTHRDLPPKALQHINASIEEYETELASIEEHISQLDLPREWYIRRELQKPVPDIQARIRACQSLLGIARRIPFETMGEIFQYYLSPGGGNPTLAADRSDDESEDDDDDQGRVELARPAPAAGILCLVCHYWKAVALATPGLWSNIKVKARTSMISKGPPQVESNHVRGIWGWMDRVSSYPWSLTINIENQDKRSDSGSVSLAQILHRPASLHMQRLSITSYHSSIQLSSTELPGVSSLVLFCPLWQASGLPLLPNVTHAVIRCMFCLDPTGLVPQIPWSQLTHLFLGGHVDLQLWNSIFKLCTVLQSGCFELVSLNDVEENPADPVVEVDFTNLTELTFIGRSPFEQSWAGISLPSLWRLRLFLALNTPSWDFSHPELFQNLTHLTLASKGDFPTSALTNILKTLPQLTELSFCMASDFPTMFEFLTYGNRGRFNLPHLKALGMQLDTLRFQMTEVWDPEDNESDGVFVFPHDSLLSLLTSRTQGVKNREFGSTTYAGLAALEHLVVRLDDAEWVDALADEIRGMASPFAELHGVRVSVCTPGAEYLGGQLLPVPLLFEHWGDGFMAFVDEFEKCNLYPRNTSF